MTTPARFSDGQYKNWLKCSQSLIIMKEALHGYVDNEVKKLHDDITLKVSSIHSGSSTGNQCGFCSWKNIKQTGGKHGTWNINCNNSICDKWLQQILAVHDEPNNPTINWKNADISKWPTDCYHVAKIFMPKGQDKTTQMPQDLDAPAILSLLKYCSWFRKDLPNTQILTDLIDIRNRVLHSGDLRVADGDKDSWIDQMIQLLSNLNIYGVAKTDLQTLKIEDIDIHLRETEIRVFQKMASDLVSELATMQNSQFDLSEEMKILRDNTTETTRKVDTVKADVQEMRTSLDELKTISDKMVSFFDKNPGILDEEITKTIRKIGMDIQDLQQNLLRVETQLNARVSSLEMQVEGIDRRLVAVEGRKENDEQLSLQEETTRKRRQESDGLKQRKNQTEDKLDTLRKLVCIPTKQAEEAKKLLEGKRSIVIKGNPGEGKTTTALRLIDTEMYRDRRVVLYCPQDWKVVDTDCVDIVVLEDLFGQFDLDPDRLQKWMVYLPTLQEHVDAGKLHVIITTRVDILSKAYSKLGSIKLFSDDLSLTLSSEQLTNSEKMSILNRELHRHKNSMKEDDKEKCISNFTGLIGFPQCCSLFAGDSKLFDKGPEFFESPKKFFVDSITMLDATRFLSLAFLFLNGEICEENLSPETITKSSQDLLNKLASQPRISVKEPSITLLGDAYNNFMDLYVVKSRSYNWKSEVYKPCIQFIHTTVYEAVGQVLGDRCVDMVVKHGDSKFLYQRTYTEKAKDSTDNVFIPVFVYGLLAKRMIHDVIKGGRLESVLKHSALKQQDFFIKLKCELHKGNKIKDFFIAGCYFRSEDDDLLSKQGEYRTFMQCILQSDKVVVRLVYDKLLEFLACAHNNNTSDCWKCEEKQKLLELALYYHHFQIADKLITMKASYTPVSLCNAARCGDLRRVQTILATLKRNRVFNPECNEAKKALCRAYISGKQSVIEFLLKEGIILDSQHVVGAVQHGDLDVLEKVVKHLKCHYQWNPHVKKDKVYLDYSKNINETYI